MCCYAVAFLAVADAVLRLRLVVESKCICGWRSLRAVGRIHGCCFNVHCLSCFKVIPFRLGWSALSLVPYQDCPCYKTSNRHDSEHDVKPRIESGTVWKSVKSVRNPIVIRIIFCSCIVREEVCIIAQSVTIAVKPFVGT